MLVLNDDTIAATATPNGRGGISVIRVSGQDSLAVVRAIAPFLPKNPESHRVFYGHLQYQGGLIDEVLVSYFEKGRSFTGEVCLEISCHGSPVIVAEVLEALCDCGARMAEPGEFTFRAFMNGRIDLVQAESIQSLVLSESKQSKSASLRHLEGDLSKQLQQFESAVTGVLAHLEANIDFAAEDIEVASSQHLVERLQGVQSELGSLLESFKAGKQLVDGLRVVLVGSPNAGKSTLFNRMVQEDRAIVSQIAGTTRDYLIGHRMIHGVRVEFIDTAGLRLSNDEIENLGVQRSREYAKKADLLWFLLDPTQDLNMQFVEAKEAAGSDLMSVLVSKSDLIDGEASRLSTDIKTLCAEFELNVDSVYFVSDADAESRDALVADISSRLPSNESSLVLLKERQHRKILEFQNAIGQAIGLLEADDSPEFIAQELQSGLVSLFEVLGKRFDDEVMDQVFREFCLGK